MEVVETEVDVLPSVWLDDDALLAEIVLLRSSETLEELLLSLPILTVVVVVALPLVESARQSAVFRLQQVRTQYRHHSSI